jgi:Arc/MetJ-type ribon-helix-helix transcriptional regulator
MGERDESSGDVIIEEKATDSDEIIVKRMENTEKGSDFNLGSTVKEMAQKTGEVIKGATESIGKAIESALSARDHVVMVRVNDDSLGKLDALVQSGIFKSRSEAAAFLISEGVKAQEPLFARIEEKIREIARLRSELKDSIKDIE